MKLTEDKVFVDTNILVYSYSNNEPEKQTIARNLIADNDSFISTQVLQELTNTVIRKFKYSYKDAIIALNESIQNNNIHVNTEITITQACKIAERYGFSFYDSLIIAAAIECSCLFLYSEDLQHNQIINDTLKIVNPF
jgi:predicted nucleic acid-binding protein